MKQNRLYGLMIGGFVLFGVVVIVFLNRDDAATAPKVAPNSFDTISQEMNPENIRLSTLENFNDVLDDRMKSLETSILDLREEKSMIEGEKTLLVQKTQELNEKIR